MEMQKWKLGDSLGSDCKHSDEGIATMKVMGLVRRDVVQRTC